MPSKKPEHLKNQFFDINKFPPEKGLLLFGLSMNKLQNQQSAENCLNYIRNFTPKMAKPLVGLNFIYSDFLYLYSEKPAPELKETFMNQVIQHKNWMQKLIEKNNLEFQIHHAFNYLVWNQLYVGANNFNEKFSQIKKLYKSDEKFQNYVKSDCDLSGRPMEDNQVNFFLEEYLMIYLLTKGEISLPNAFILNEEKWILFCYPSAPLKGGIYLYQLNPFNLDWSENPYHNSYYDLENQKLIDMTEIDLETYDPQ